MGDLANASQIGTAVLVVGCFLAAASLLLIVLVLTQTQGVGILARWPGCVVIGHSVLLVAWLPVLALAAALVANGHDAAVAFVVAGALGITIHGGCLLSRLSCCSCCWSCVPGGPAADHPKLALLTGTTTQKQPHSSTGSTGSPGPAAAAGAHGGAATGGAADPAAPGDASGGGDVEAARNNPFRTTYGILPGSGGYGYTIFLPGAEEQTAAAAHRYTGLQDGPSSRRTAAAR